MKENFQENNDPIENSPKGGNDPALDLSGLHDGYWHPEYDISQLDENERAKIFRSEAYKLAYDQKLDESSSQEQFKFFIDNLTGNEKWLDLGSGLGTYIVHFLQEKNKLKQENLLSIDLDMENLKYLEDIRRGGSKINADASAIPLADGSIDVLVTHMMIADNEVNKNKKLTKIKEEISRVLKSDGVVVTDTNHEVVDENVFEKWFEFNPPKGRLVFYRRKNN